jgi:hypothetical protein
VRAILALIAIAVLAGACSSSPAATPSFDPTGPCATDGKAAGAYPDLEALVPKTLDGKPPQTLNSGRNCTLGELGTLSTHGVSEVRFAGGVWQDGSQNGLTMAVFQEPGLQSEWMAEWYEATALGGNTTGDVQPTKPTIDGRPAQRLDLVNGDAAQTVITWPSTTPNTVNVVLASDEPEARIQEAIAAFK